MTLYSQVRPKRQPHAAQGVYELVQSPRVNWINKLCATAGYRPCGPHFSLLKMNLHLHVLDRLSIFALLIINQYFCCKFNHACTACIYVYLCCLFCVICLD